MHRLSLYREHCIASRAGVELPVSAAAQHLYAEAKVNHGDKDFSAVVLESKAKSK